MIALVRYQIGLLLRAHRWIPPAVLFALGVAGLGGATQRHGTGLNPGLAWSALMLVPVTAWLTRSMLTAEPEAARAVVAAAGGPRRTHLAALMAAGLAGFVLGPFGIVWEVISLGLPRAAATNSIQLGRAFSDVGGGLVAMLICLLVGSAVAAVLNPPVIRPPAAGVLGTAGAVILALAWNISPANAAVRGVGYSHLERTWPAGAALITALILVVLAWAISAQVAARRDG